MKKKVFILFFLIAVFAEVSGQNGQIMYFMNLPQNHFLNPALRPSNKLYIGIPVLSGININMNNNYLNFSDVFLKGEVKDSIITVLHPGYNPDKFLAKIKDANSLETQTVIQILGIGFSIGNDGYVFLDANERIETNFVFPGDLFRLALSGNESFAGKTINLSSLRADAKYFREIGVGYSGKVTDRLRVGVKGKFLFGIAGASLTNNSFGLKVNDDFTHTLTADLAVNMSGPVSATGSSVQDIRKLTFQTRDVFDNGNQIREFFSNWHNPGLAVDLGASFDVTDRIVLSASVTDLGFIRWKKDLTNMKAKNQFEFSGLNLTDYFNDTRTIQEIGDDLVDSLAQAFVVSNTRQPFTTYLPVGVTIGGSFNLNKSISLGILSYSRIIASQIHEAITVSANLNITNAFSASLGYSAENGRYDNLGAGLAFRAGVAQFYLASDRIPVMWNKIITENRNTLFLPASWNTFNLRMGMNLVFGNREKQKKDRPMVEIQ